MGTKIYKTPLMTTGDPPEEFVGTAVTVVKAEFEGVVVVAFVVAVVLVVRVALVVAVATLALPLCIDPLVRWGAFPAAAHWAALASSRVCPAIFPPGLIQKSMV